MAVPAGVGLFWPDTAGSTPAGWDRDTDSDDRFAKGTGSGVDPDVGGGATGHSHTQNAHSHTGTSTHSHTGPTSAQGQNQTITNAAPSISLGSHSHAYTSGTIRGDAASTGATGQSTTLDPTWFRVIHIESDGTPAGFPDGCLVFLDDATAPSGWTQHAASVGRYFKGAAAAGDGGGTGGAIAAHTHTSNSHIHAVAAHTHGSVTSVAGPNVNHTSVGSTVMQANHTHTVTFGSAATGSFSATTIANPGSTTAEPAFHKLQAIENTGGADDFLLEAILTWRGLLSAIPGGFALCDGTVGTPDLRDRFIKATVSGSADLGDTGGSATHDHTNPAAHSHASSNHTHLATGASTGAGGSTIPGGGQAGAIGAHGHAAAASAAGGTASNNNSPTVEIDTASSEPEFRTVAWLQLQSLLLVTIVSPTEAQTITDPSPTIDWTVTGGGTQVDFRVRIYSDESETQLVHDSGTVASAVTEHTVPSGVLLTSQTYFTRVEVNDDGGPPVNGISELRSFLTVWIPPDPVTGVTATPVGGD